MRAMIDAPGFYGKVPIVGDFVSRRLPAEFIQSWDAWLQGALSASRETLGSQWLDHYLISPIWRFVLSPGSCATAAWSGILMPSVDKVGRYFPLTLAGVVNESDLLPSLFVKAASWFETLEELALSALQDDLDLDELDQQLSGLAFSPPSSSEARYHPGSDLHVRQDHHGFYIKMNQLEQLPSALMQLHADLLNHFFPVYSLWCTRGSQQMKPALRAYQGMPPSALYAEFLSDPGRSGNGCEAGAQTPVSWPPAARGEIDAPLVRGVQSDAALGWRSCARTTIGKRRQINEDAYLERPDIGLWAVADGMGGHWAGDVASKATVDALDTLRGSDQLQTWIGDVTACLHQINEELITMAHSRGDGQIMGTTVVSMLAVGNRCAAVWAGDSRLYRYREGMLSQLTNDHSLLAELAQQQDAPPGEVAEAAYGNVVTRALGADAELLLDTITYEAKRGDIYLLCSDGLVKEVHDPEIATLLSHGSCQESSQALIDLALERGGRDNVTVIVVHAH